MATNKERQKSLDKKKWLKSEKKGMDMSGEMLHCPYCEKRTPRDWQSDGFLRHGCTATQEERETACLCATAYNRMQRYER
jgi:hypothetical protein